jgi:hypothetical protein
MLNCGSPCGAVCARADDALLHQVDIVAAVGVGAERMPLLLQDVADQTEPSSPGIDGNLVRR